MPEFIIAREPTHPYEHVVTDDGTTMRLYRLNRDFPGAILDWVAPVADNATLLHESVERPDPLDHRLFWAGLLIGEAIGRAAR